MATLFAADRKATVTQITIFHKNGLIIDKAQFLLQLQDGGVKIWCKAYQSIAPSCLVSGWWWMINSVKNIFLGHFGHLSQQQNSRRLWF